MSKSANRAIPITTKPCPHCQGTGRVPCVDGWEMQRRRVAARVTLRELGRRMGLPPAYLSDLESGQIQWVPEEFNWYLDVLEGKGDD